MTINRAILLSLLLLPAIICQAQTDNPFESIGKKGKILTLSKGKYVETFDYDSVERIGSVLINIRTRKIIRLLKSDRTFRKYSDNSSASRWYSVDPLAEKYASISPYAAMGNNPIIFVDADGRDLIVKGSAAAQDQYANLLTKTTGRQVSINHETGQLSIGDAVKTKGKTSAILAALVDNVVKDNYKYQVSLTGENGDDENVYIDSYNQAKIDIADLKTIDKGTDNAFLAGVLGHFLFEISSTDDYNDKDSRAGKFDAAHQKALGKEGEIVGGMLGIGTNPRTTDPQQVSGEDAKEENIIYSYGSGDKIADYLLTQGVSGVKVTKGTVNIGGVDIPSTTYEVVPNGKLRKAKKGKDAN